MLTPLLKQPLFVSGNHASQRMCTLCCWVTSAALATSMLVAGLGLVLGVEQSTCFQGSCAEVIYAAGPVGDIPQHEHVLRAAEAARRAMHEDHVRGHPGRANHMGTRGT